MPWRLMGFILIFVIFLVFIAFNLENKCSINLLFQSFAEVPVYLTAFSSFVLGMLCAIPFILGIKKKHHKKVEEAEKLPQPKKKWPWSKVEKGEDVKSPYDDSFGIN